MTGTSVLGRGPPLNKSFNKRSKLTKLISIKRNIRRLGRPLHQNFHDHRLKYGRHRRRRKRRSDSRVLNGNRRFTRNTLTLTSNPPAGPRRRHHHRIRGRRGTKLRHHRMTRQIGQHLPGHLINPIMTAVFMISLRGNLRRPCPNRTLLRRLIRIIRFLLLCLGRKKGFGRGRHRGRRRHQGRRRRGPRRPQAVIMGRGRHPRGRRQDLNRKRGRLLRYPLGNHRITNRPRRRITNKGLVRITGNRNLGFTVLPRPRHINHTLNGLRHVMNINGNGRNATRHGRRRPRRQPRRNITITQGGTIIGRTLTRRQGRRNGRNEGHRGGLQRPREPLMTPVSLGGSPRVKRGTHRGSEVSQYGNRQALLDPTS